jgi:hypothetical protein
MTTTTIIAKFSEGLRSTHNSDGRYVRSWRLLSNGRVERTNQKSKYVPAPPREAIPNAIREAAATSGIAIVR